MRTIAVFALILLQTPGQEPQKPEAPPPEIPVAPPAQEPEPDQVAFDVADYNHNGWISFLEAQESLQLDQASYWTYDRDRDGRITREEFRARYRAIVERAGGFRPPVPRKEKSLVPTRNAEQLRNAYDRNGDGGVGLEELRSLLIDYDREELPVEVALEKLDRDVTGRIDGEELELLARLLSATHTIPRESSDAPAPGHSIEELFGGVKLRGTGFQAAPQPPQIGGPVTHFRRLDLDNDGRVTIDDLMKLQSPMQLSIRAGTVLAALDLDQDGALSEQEFLDAMRRR
jgi:Ca2+-binding EF-hand superfamily protein